MMLFIYLLTAQAIPLMFFLIDDFSGIGKEYESGILNITSNTILCHLKAVSVANSCLFIYICPRTTHVEFPWVLVFEVGISKAKEYHTILQNFQK